MLEWIVIVAALGLLASRLSSRHFEKARSDWGLKRRNLATLAEVPPPRPLPTLTITGAERAQGVCHGHVRAFGLDPASLQDLRVYRGDAMGRVPERVEAILADLHRAGCALGADIMEIVHCGRPLPYDRAIYFALVQPGGCTEPHVVAFVDRVR